MDSITRCNYCGNKGEQRSGTLCLGCKIGMRIQIEARTLTPRQLDPQARCSRGALCYYCQRKNNPASIKVILDGRLREVHLRCYTKQLKIARQLGN